MKQKLFLLYLGLTVMFLTGCHFIPDEELYNNTDGDLTVTTFTWIDGKTHTNINTFTVGKNQSTALGVPFKLEIQQRGNIQNYDITWIPYEFWGSIGGNRRLAKLQIQEDGSIYLLLPKSITPVTNFPPQPVNYPLKPKS